MALIEGFCRSFLAGSFPIDFQVRTRKFERLFGTAPLYPFLRKRIDRAVTSTDLLAKAMLRLAIIGNVKKILRTSELNHLTRSFSVSAD
jgi:hypothetical protein